MTDQHHPAYLALMDRLERIRRQMRLRDLCVALSWLIVVITPLSAVLVWIDYHYRPANTGRWISLGVLLLVIEEVVRRKVWSHITRRRSRTAVALAIESAHPQLDARLVSTVELGGTPEPRSDMIPRVISETADLCAATPLESVIDWASRRKLFVPAAVLLLVSLFAIAWAPGGFAIWLSRTLAPWTSVDWPSRSWVELIQVPEHVRRGDPLPIEGHIKGLVPRDGTLLLRQHSRTADGGHWRRIPFYIASSGIFAATFEPALFDVELYAIAGDGRSENRQVRVIAPPEVAGVRGLLKYRPYTGKAATPVENGDLEALAGTAVDLTIRSNSPMVKGELVFASGLISAATITGSTECRARFEIRQDDKYEIRLYDEYNYCAEAPVSWEIHAIPDELPSVLIREPESEKRVTPLSTVNLLAEGSDDFRVINADIVWELESGQNAGRVPIAMATAAKEVKVSTPWDLAGMSLQTGVKVRYWVEMGDEAPYRGEDEKGRSAPALLIVMEPEQLRKLIDERLTGFYEQLEDIERQINRGIDEMSQASATLLGGATSPQDIASSVRAEEWRQVEVARRLLTVGKGLEIAAADLTSAHLAQPEEADRLTEAGKQIAALSTQNLETILTELRAARRRLEGVE